MSSTRPLTSSIILLLLISACTVINADTQQMLRGESIVLNERIELTFQQDEETIIIPGQNWSLLLESGAELQAGDGLELDNVDINVFDDMVFYDGLSVKPVVVVVVQGEIRVVDDAPTGDTTLRLLLPNLNRIIMESGIVPESSVGELVSNDQLVIRTLYIHGSTLQKNLSRGLQLAVQVVLLIGALAILYTIGTAINQGSLEPFVNLFQFPIAIITKIGGVSSRTRKTPKHPKLSKEQRAAIADYETNIELLIRRKQYSGAVKMCRKILAINSNHADANYALGYMYAKHKKYQEAAQYLEVAAKQNHPKAKAILQKIQPKRVQQTQQKTQSTLSTIEMQAGKLTPPKTQPVFERETASPKTSSPERAKTEVKSTVPMSTAPPKAEAIQKWVDQLVIQQQQKQAIASLIQAGKSAVPALIAALPDEERTPLVQGILVQIGDAVILPLVHFIEQQEPQSEQWHLADQVLSKLYDAPSHQDVEQLKRTSKQATWWFLVPWGVVLVLNALTNAGHEDEVTSILLAGTFIAYIFWCGYWFWQKNMNWNGIIGMIWMAVTTPFVAYRHRQQSKAAQQQRAEYIEHYATLVNRALTS